MNAVDSGTEVAAVSVAGKLLIIIVIIIITSFAPISSNIKLSGATKPRD